MNEPAADSTTQTLDRGPPRGARLLLPVWGERYLRRFFDFSLPTMIAPGNIPAVAAQLPSTFVFLTSRQDAAFIAEHPGYRYLRSICPTEIEPIDDLITGDNVSTTITLAYERAVRATGPGMLDTCFFFLISDYLMADGSLANVLQRMRGGTSGLLAGNFQIVEEDAAPQFHGTFAKGVPALSLEPRALMRWALPYLHPMTSANTVNFPLNHSAHSNRLFWRVDENTLIGRFYLMHMICIRPETEDFVVGSSCDYSFIPEMCPSRNVGVLTDSDDYLVVEMQPRTHERAFLRPGPPGQVALADSLSEWTTDRHRENAWHTVVFRAADLPPALPAIVADADRFIDEVGRRLAPAPQPHRDHPYWIGAIAAHRWARDRMRETQPASGADAQEAAHVGYSLAALIQKLRVLTFGRPPDVRVWHPRWADYRPIAAELRALLRQQAGPLAVIAHAPELLQPWISHSTGDVRFLQTNRFLGLPRNPYAALVGNFSGVLLLLAENELHDIRYRLDRVLPLLAPGGFLLVAAINGRADRMRSEFGTDFALYSSQFLIPECRVEHATFVRIGWGRIAILSTLRWIDTAIQRYPLHAVLFALPVGLLMLASGAANLLTRPMRIAPGRPSLISSVSLLLRPTPKQARMPIFASDPTGYWAKFRDETPIPEER